MVQCVSPPSRCDYASGLVRGPILDPGRVRRIIRCDLTAVSSLLAQGVPFVPEDRQREPADISIPRASVEAIRCNLTAASSLLAEGVPFVPKDRQQEPADETVVAEDLDGQEEAEEEESRKGECGGKGSRKDPSRGRLPDIDSRSRSHDRRGQSQGSTRGSCSRVAEVGTSIEAVRCNLTAAISVLTEGELSVPKDRQREPTDETAVTADMDGQEEAEEEEPRKGTYDGEGSRKGRRRGKPRDIDSRSRSRSRDRRGQSKGGTRGSRSQVAELDQVRPDHSFADYHRNRPPIEINA